MIILALLHDEPNSLGPDFEHESYKTCKCLFAKDARIQMSEIENKQPMEFPIIDEIIRLFESAFPAETNPENLKKMLMDVFNFRGPTVRSLVTENGEGKDYSALVLHIKKMEVMCKALKACHSAAELAYVEFVKSATLKERERIEAEDKKYKPQYKEREKRESEIKSDVSKKVKNLMKLYMDMLKLSEDEARERAEKILFGK